MRPLIRRAGRRVGRRADKEHLIHGQVVSEAALLAAVEEADPDDPYLPGATGGDLTSFREVVDAVLDMLRPLDFPLQVYRGLLLSEGERPDPARVGWWTWDKEVALAYAEGRHQAGPSRTDLLTVPWLQTGVVRAAGDVHWPATVQQNYEFTYGAGGSVEGEDRTIVAATIHNKTSRRV